MLNHTKKIKQIYEVIQKMIFYMIPEKWDKLYLYSSVIDMPEGEKSGELYTITEDGYNKMVVSATDLSGKKVTINLTAPYDVTTPSATV